MSDLARLRSLAAARSEHIRAAAALTAELRRLVVAHHAAGVQKVDLAALAQVSRPTLDEWLKREEER